MLQDSTIIAIVFKGTENLNDWKTNLRWFRKFLTINTNDYYDQLNETSDSIMNEIINIVANDSIKIITAGHSLGGGLAQFMAYRINEIKQVYAFNPSPVTGFYDVPKSERKKNKQGCKIYRIYESGEVLSTFRKLMTILYPAPLIKTKNPALIRIRTSFTSDTSTITQHSICLLYTSPSPRDATLSRMPSSA